MARIIKPQESNGSEIFSYERELLETTETDSAGYVDPASILAEARAEAEEKVRAAFAEGLERGRKAGLKKFEDSVGEAEQVLKVAGEELKAARQAYLDDMEPRLAQLASAIAAKILGREAEIGQDLVKKCARTALESIIDLERVTLKVNPGDLNAIREHKVQLLDDFDGLGQLEIVADESVDPGGCIAVSDRLHVDAQWEMQIQQILEQLAQK
ncbi:MAG: hypothetical protein IID08_09550 [Candidatus Hydrogenedentes bacterium]|nr:hypothetical protein [Candidatus Hydrogenedentota bacterium]